MSKGKSREEHHADQRLAELDSEMGPALSRNPITRLMMRADRRPEYERLAVEYLSLFERGEGSRLLALKILRVLDRIRSPDVGLHAIRIAPMGRPKRRPWQSVANRQHDSTRAAMPVSTTDARMLRPCRTGFPERFVAPADPHAADLACPNMDGSDILDLTNVLVLHLGFLGDGLLVALDGNIETHFYGSAAVADRCLRGSAFADYDYEPASLNPDRVTLAPRYRAGVRPGIARLADELHSTVERYMEKLSRREIASEECRQMIRACISRVVKEMEELIGYEGIMRSLRQWAGSQGCSLKDLCLVILPDQHLFRLPLSFLGASQSTPLVTTFGGISIGLGMSALKWLAYEHHWYTVPNLSPGGPHCVVFAAEEAPDCQPLDLSSEVDGISAGLGKENCAIWRGRVSRRDFLNTYSAGDICWFAGHGAWEPGTALRVEDNIVPFPLGGPHFWDGPLTNWDLLATSNWNFTMLWLTVMNSCTLGNTRLVGPNPLGFVTALRAVGSVSTVAALWPVFNRPAECLGRNLAEQLTASFHGTGFARARALSKAVENTIADSRTRWDEWDVAPYALWGLP